MLFTDFLFKRAYFIFLIMCVLRGMGSYVCTLCACIDCKFQKRAPRLLDLEGHSCVLPDKGAGNPT